MTVNNKPRTVYGLSATHTENEKGLERGQSDMSVELILVCERSNPRIT